jgi:branched-chain amino acid transport system substrate-binding protein
MAVEEINAAGGVMGKPLELITAYSETRDYTSVHKTLAQLKAQGATAVVIAPGSGVVVEAAAFAVRHRLLLMASTATSPYITWLNDKNLVWRTVPSDVHQARIAAAYITNDLSVKKYRKAAVLHIDNPYGNELAFAFRQEFEKRRGRVVASVSYPDKPSYKNHDFKRALENLYARKPDVVYLVGYIDDSAQILHQSKKYGWLTDQYKPLLFGCDGNYNGDFLLNTDAVTVEGMMGLTYIHPSKYAGYEAFVSKFKEFTAAVSDSVELANATLSSLLDIETTYSFAATSYDAVYTLALAMQKAESTAPKAMATALGRISKASAGAVTVGVGGFGKALQALKEGKRVNYDGASGLIEFDQRGDVTSGTYLAWRVKNGKFTDEKIIAFP